MNIKSALQNTLYFIPLVGTIHHARELCKLNREYQELAKFAPSIKNISGWNTISTQLRNLKSFNELDTLSEEIKIKASKYFAQKNQINQFAAWGSMVQVIICLAAQALNPVFLILGRLESFHMFYSTWKLSSAPNLYFYDSEKKTSLIHQRDLFFQSAIFGKKIVPMTPELDELKHII